MRQIQYVAASFLIVLLAACAQLGLPQAETFNQKVAVALGTVTQVRTSATTLLDAKTISVDDAQNVLTATDNARAGIDIARKAHATDPAGADSKLTAIRATLTAIAGYLATKQGGK